MTFSDNIAKMISDGDGIMVNYQQMYQILFNKMTDIIEEIQQVQRQTEEMYIHSQNRELILVKSGRDSEEPEKNK